MNLLKKYRLDKIIIFLCIISLFYLSPYTQLLLVRLLNWNVDKLSDVQSIILMTFSNTCLLIVYLLFYFKSIKKDLKTFLSNPMINLNTALKYWLIGLGIMFISNIIINIFNGQIAGNEQTVREMIKVMPWLLLINAGLIAPFNEEIIFRRSLSDIFKNKWIFVFASFLLFGLAHVVGNINSMLDYLYIIPYGALGGVFALAYRNTDSIITSMIMHMFHNSFTILLLIFIA